MMQTVHKVGVKENEIDEMERQRGNERVATGGIRPTT